MFCSQCNTEIEKCTCPDLADRMRVLSGVGGAIAARWCAACDDHYAVCRCASPEWKMRVDGKLEPLPDHVAAEFASTGEEPAA